METWIIIFIIIIVVCVLLASYFYVKYKSGRGERAILTRQQGRTNIFNNNRPQLSRTSAQRKLQLPNNTREIIEILNKFTYTGERIQSLESSKIDMIMTFLKNKGFPQTYKDFVNDTRRASLEVLEEMTNRGMI